MPSVDICGSPGPRVRGAFHGARPVKNEPCRCETVKEGEERQGKAAALERSKSQESLRLLVTGSDGPRQGLTHLHGFEELGLGVKQPVEKMCVREK